MKLALAFQTPLFVLLKVMSAEEFTLWQAFDEWDPISLHHRVDLAAGVIASTNLNKSLKEGKEPIPPSDFMPVMQAQKKQEPKPGMSPIQLKEFMDGQIKAQEKRKQRAERLVQQTRETRHSRLGKRKK